MTDSNALNKKSLLHVLIIAVGVAGAIISAIVVGIAIATQKSDIQAGWIPITSGLVILFLVLVLGIIGLILSKASQKNQASHSGEQQLRQKPDGDKPPDSSYPKEKEKDKDKGSSELIKGLYCFFTLLVLAIAIFLFFHLSIPVRLANWWSPPPPVPSGGFSVPAQPAVFIPPYQGAVCLDDTGHEKELDYLSFSDKDFTESFEDGCGTLIKMPEKWGYHWHAQPADNDRSIRRHIYVAEIGHPYRGPYDLWGDITIPLPSLTFYVQPPSGEKGLRMYFWTDLDLPIAIPVVSEPDELRIYKVGEGGVTAPIPIKTVDAAYTDDARRANFNGTVVVKIVVDENGRAINPKIVVSPGLGLDEEVLRVIDQWEWMPAMKDGIPVPTYGTIEVKFQR